MSGNVFAALRPLVRSVVAYDYTGLAPGAHAGLPSTSLTLIVAIGDPLVVSMGNQPRPYRVLLGGLHLRPARVEFGESLAGVQVALGPDAARRLFDCSAAELAHGCLELDSVLTGFAERLAERANLADRGQRVRTVCAELLARLAEPRPLAPQLRHAWELLTGRRPATAGAVAECVGWSQRHLEQRFAREFGITPGQAAGLGRFERSVGLVKRGDRLADVAAATGYADQAHLARDWRRLAGSPPSRWIRDDGLAFVQA